MRATQIGPFAMYYKVQQSGMTRVYDLPRETSLTEGHFFAVEATQPWGSAMLG